MKIKAFILYLIVIAAVFYLVNACGPAKEATQAPHEEIVTNPRAEGIDLVLEFKKGKAHNHPLMAVWVETTDSQYIQTLYVARSIAKGYYQHGDKSEGFWKPGPIRRPAALPYWAHKRGVKAEDGLFIPSQKNPMPDAVTSATPKGDFTLKTKAMVGDRDKFIVLMEINQTWDWNEYWTNNKYPDNEEYKTSCQPALVYAVEVDLNKSGNFYKLKPIGHSHYAGENGYLYRDLSTLTTALEIAEGVTLRF